MCQESAQERRRPRKTNVVSREPAWCRAVWLSHVETAGYSNDAATEGYLLYTHCIGDYDELPNNKVSEPKGALVVWRMGLYKVSTMSRRR